MDAIRQSMTTPRAAIDELAEALERRFAIIDAQAQAQALRADEVLAEALDLHARALQAQREAIDGQRSLREIEQAGVEHRRTLARVRQIEGWRGVDPDQLALDLFVRAPSVAEASERGWRPSSPPATTMRPVQLRSPRLRFADHFEPDIDLLIVDHRLGTLALVQWLEFDDRPVHERVREHVERATYLRHLLVAEQAGGRQTLTVELVLVHPAAKPGEPGFAMLAAAGELLRDLALDTDCLHAIGINLLALEAGRAPAEGELRRAFAWLLHDSQRWFADLDPLARSSSDARLARIELDEYRLAGHRELSLHPSARLHLLHGHNGSGKSSLVEALELMLTGGIERLGGVDDYEAVIRNRHADPGAAAIRLVDQGGREYAFELAGAARPSPLAPGSRAASFRLDQTVMDRLARASEIDRAAELLAAFFAEEAAVREQWRAALAAVDEQVEQLPERLRRWLTERQRDQQALHDVVIEQFVGLGEGRLRRELVDAILPLELDSLLALRGQLPALELLDVALTRDGSIAIDDSIFTSLELELGGLVGELGRHQRELSTARRALDRASRWWHDTQHPRSAYDFAEAVDEWLELGALAELVERQQEILRALVGARASGWDDRRLDDAGPGAELLRTLANTDLATLADLAQVRARWERRRAELGAVLDRRVGAGPSSGEGPVGATRVRLDVDEVAALDEFGRWLASEREPIPLGQRIRAAIEDEGATSFAGRAIGTHAWTLPLREQVDRMLDSLARLRQAAAELARSSASPPLERPPTLGDSTPGLGRDEDAPTIPTRERESIGELPITIEEALPEPAQAKPRAQAKPMARPLETALDDAFLDENLALGAELEDHDEGPDAPDDTPDEEESDDHTSAFERLSQTLLGRSKRPVRRKQGPEATQTSRRSPAAANAGGSAAPSAAPAPLPSFAAPEPTQAEARGPDEFVALSGAPEPSPPAERVELRAMLDRLRSAHAASLEAARVGAQVRESFVARLAAHDEGAMGLVDALNELMALFTPARWAYEDVLLRYQEDGNTPRLQFETGNHADATRSRADLRLNTAQLNAFVLALFLLCAPRVPNPLGLLVLDDPLQNMDELTVTTLARGLAKLVRVMPQRWTLMMLFHGEGDLARFHDEVECGVYLLPWLSPTQLGSEQVIACRPETSRLGLVMQRLLGFVSLRP